MSGAPVVSAGGSGARAGAVSGMGGALVVSGRRW